ASKLVRYGEGARLWSGESGGSGVLVAGTEAPDVVELWDWSLPAGETHTSEAHTDGTRELLQVQEGSLRILIGEEIHELESGDALTFQGNRPHSYTNPYAEPARFSLAVFEPGVGTAHRAETSNG